MRHLAIFMHDLSGGGVERMRLALIAAFLGRGLRVTLLLHRRAGELSDAVPIGCEVVELGGRSTLGDVPALSRFLRRARPDLLMSSLDHNNVAALLAARLSRTGVPVVICQHNALSAEAGTMGWRYRAVPALYRLLAPRAAGIVAVSEGVADDMARATGLARDAITVIHNPVISAGFAARATEALPEPWAGDPWMLDRSVPLLVSAGRLVAQKDPETLLRAFALMPAHARLLLLGRGELQGALEALVAELGLGERVRFAGFQPNPLPFIARADAFVLASRYEGLGNVLVEALGCGTPVASTDCPHGPSEILEGGRHGALAPVGDAHALAAAMLQALRVPPDEASLRLRAEQFTVERAVARHLALFEHALAASAQAADVPATGAVPAAPDGRRGREATEAAGLMRARVRIAARTPGLPRVEPRPARAHGEPRRVFGLALSPLGVSEVVERVVREAPPPVGEGPGVGLPGAACPGSAWWSRPTPTTCAGCARTRPSPPPTPTPRSSPPTAFRCSSTPGCAARRPVASPAATCWPGCCAIPGSRGTGRSSWRTARPRWQGCAAGRARGGWRGRSASWCRRWASSATPSSATACCAPSRRTAPRCC